MKNNSLFSDTPTPAYQRGAVNIIVTNTLYQRGQIMTWDLGKKQFLFEEYNVGIVVNFWSKLDADMSECPPTYVYRPTPHSINMLDKDILLLADYVTNYITKKRETALILCEAGKTRSVFFSTLVLAKLESMSYNEARKTMDILLPNHKMKQFMIDFLDKGKIP